MKRKRFTEEQIIGVLKQAEVGAKTAQLYRQVGITPQTFYRWKAKYGGMKVVSRQRKWDTLGPRVKRELEGLRG